MQIIFIIEVSTWGVKWLLIFHIIATADFHSIYISPFLRKCPFRRANSFIENRIQLIIY